MRVRSPEAGQLREKLLAKDVRVSSLPSLLEVEGMAAEQIGDLAARDGFVIHELTPETTSLEDAFIELTREETEYRAARPSPETPASADQHRIAA